MTLYQIATGQPPAAADINQYIAMLSGTNGPPTDMVVANRIRAQLSGASATSGFVGGTTGYSVPTSGTWATGDWCAVQDAGIAVCTSGGSPGSWRYFGSWSYADNATQSQSGTLQPLVSRTGRTGFDVLMLNTSFHGMPYFSNSGSSWTIPQPGWWFLNLNVQFASHGSGDQAIIILRDGAIAAVGPQFDVFTNGNCTFGTMLRLSSGDVIQAAAYSEFAQPLVFWGEMSFGLCLVAA